jgi:hypothetical protein
LPKQRKIMTCHASAGMWHVNCRGFLRVGALSSPGKGTIRGDRRDGDAADHNWT